MYSMQWIHCTVPVLHGDPASVSDYIVRKMCDFYYAGHSLSRFIPDNFTSL